MLRKLFAMQVTNPMALYSTLTVIHHNKPTDYVADFANAEGDETDVVPLPTLPSATPLPLAPSAFWLQKCLYSKLW